MRNTATMVMGGNKTNSMKRVTKVFYIDLSNYRFDKLPKLSRKDSKEVVLAK